MNGGAKSYLDQLFNKLGGVTPAVGDAFNPLSAAAIRDIETACAIELPERLKQVLQTYGAIMFRAHVTYTPEQEFPRTYSKTNRGVVEVLLGQMHDDFPRARSISILHRKHLLSDVLGNEFLPIGDDGLGDVICLSLGPNTYGEIVLWNHDAPLDEGIYFVARSYGEWIERLQSE